MSNTQPEATEPTLFELESQTQEAEANELMAQMALAFADEQTPKEEEVDEEGGTVNGNAESEGGEENNELSGEEEGSDEGDQGVQPPEPKEEVAAGLSPQELQRAQELVDWASKLTPVQEEAINKVLSGQYNVVPVVEQKPAEPQEPEIEWLDPRAAQEVARLNEKIAKLEELEQPIRNMQFQQAAEQRTTADTQISLAKKQFMEAHELSANEMNAVEQNLVNLNIYQNLIQAEGGSYLNAALRGFDMVYATDPTYQNREVEAQLQEERSEAKDRKVRKLKAASLSGKGGSVSRVPAPPSTNEERHEAMTNELREILSNS